MIPRKRGGPGAVGAIWGPDRRKVHVISVVPVARRTGTKKARPSRAVRAAALDEDALHLFLRRKRRIK
ncbi:MAG: hypothetical protein KC417_04985, partial [Myxococcales bacterium]|nr:hypothetical protein [Myxococcales bacterium]